MKILFISQIFPAKKGIRNTSSALREFVEEWGRKGHEIKVIRPHFSYEGEPFPSKPKFNIGENITVEFIKPLRIPLLKLSFYNNDKIIRELPFKPDVIVCHLYNSYFLFHKLSKKLKIPLVIGIHMSDIRISKMRFHRWHQKMVFKKAVSFACRTHQIQRLFSKQFPNNKNKSFLALSGIPVEFFKTNTQTHNTSNKIRLITVSSLIKRKQIEKVIQTLATDEIINKNWEYTIIGSGNMEKDLKQLSSNLNIDSKIFFKGQMERNQVIKELSEHDIFILPSYSETLGLVYLESMASGCITIGSKNEGIDGIIVDGENGFLCDANNLASIKEKLLQALTQPENEKTKMINNALETVTGFTIENKAQEYMKQLKCIHPTNPSCF